MTDLTADERAKVEAAAAEAFPIKSDTEKTVAGFGRIAFRLGAHFLAQLRPHAPKGGEECDVCGGLGYVECGTGESATSWKQACPCQENSEAHPPATEARIEKGLIDGVEVDFLIENPPATDARVGRSIERMRELGQAMPPNAVSMDIQKALREFEVKG